MTARLKEHSMFFSAQTKEGRYSVFQLVGTMVLKDPSTNILHVALFYPEDEGNIFFRSRRSVVGSGIMLQAGRSWFRFPMRSLNILFDLIFPAAL
jgi:hypothetical protein